MDQDKINHFYEFREPGDTEEFPKFRTLNSEECSIVRVALQNSFRNFEGLNGLQIRNSAFKEGTTLVGVNAGEANFTPASALLNSGVSVLESVYINWYNFDQIDELAFHDLNAAFSDIWWPGPDDINIFDASYKWILSIDHDGYISLLKSS